MEEDVSFTLIPAERVEYSPPTGEEAKETFGEFEKIKPYLRFTRLDDS